MSRTPSAELTERYGELSDALLVLLLDAFREGLRAGEKRAAEALDADIDALLADLEKRFHALDREGVAVLADGYRDAEPSPLAAAYFGAAADALIRLRGKQRRR